MKLSDDFSQAMKMAMEIEELCEQLPGLDCGSCGSPSCRALAEDIVRGYASETDCIFVTREKFKDLLNHMSENNIEIPADILEGLEKKE